MHCIEAYLTAAISTMVRIRSAAGVVIVSEG